VPHTGSML